MSFLGKLSWDAVPFDQPIPLAASALMIVAVLLVLGWITLRGHWPYLALAFGLLIVTLVVAGSLLIMFNLNANMMPSGDVMNMHMQH
jgi:hypothetical protein